MSGADPNASDRRAPLARRSMAPVALLAMLVSVGPVVGPAARAADDHRADLPADTQRSDEERALAELRQQGRVDLAEAFCKQRCSDPNLPPRRRAEWAVELMRTYALAAVDSKPEDRPPWWDRAHRVAVDFPQHEAVSPFGLLVHFEDARVWIDQAAVGRADRPHRPTTDRSAAGPLPALRTALRALDQLDAALATRRRRLGRNRPLDEGLSREEIDALQRHVAYQASRALRFQGQCYAAGTPDRANSFQQALERLTPLAELPVADDLVWRSRVDQVACYRFLGKDAEAAQFATRLLDSDPPPEIADAVRAEQIRAELASRHIDRAVAAAEAVATTTGRDAADLELARLEAKIAAWRRAKGPADTETTTRLAKRAADQVQRIRQRLSPYWTQQAETMLARELASGNVDLGALKRAAQMLYQGGQTTDAEAAYDQIARLAADQGQVDQAIDAAFTAATIEYELARQGRETTEKLKHHRSAMQRFGDVADSFPDHPRAAEADLLAIYHTAEIARHRTGAGRQDALDQYARRIQRHLQRWPRGASAGQLRMWLGRLRQAQRRWEEAIAAFRAVPADDPHFEAAAQAIAQCYDQWQAQRPQDAAVQQALAERLGESQDRRELERAVTTWQLVQRLSPAATPRWFLARYRQSEILARLGEKAKAAKLITVTKALHPSLGGPALRRKFDRLLEKCQ